jgi:hypothetical protein
MNNPNAQSTATVPGAAMRSVFVLCASPALPSREAGCSESHRSSRLIFPDASSAASEKATGDPMTTRYLSGFASCVKGLVDTDRD